MTNLQKQYDREYNLQSVKLTKKIGQAKAAMEVGIPKNTVYDWVRASRLGKLELGAGMQTPESARILNADLFQLRQQLKAQEKEIRLLKKEKSVYLIVHTESRMESPRQIEKLANRMIGRSTISRRQRLLRNALRICPKCLLQMGSYMFRTFLTVLILPFLV